MRRIFAILVFTVLIPQIASASGNDLEASLNQQYKNKGYSLRHFVAKDFQRYDSSGTLLSGGREGPWTVYSRLLIRKVKVRSNKLTVEADRIGYVNDVRSNRLVPMKLGDSATLEIALDQPLASSEQADAVLSRIFALTLGDFLASVPPWWRPFLESNREIFTPDGGNPPEKKEVVTPQKPASASEVKSPHPPVKDAEGVYHVGNGVGPPVPVFTPDPSYTDAARKARFNGVNAFEMVIDESGRMESCKLLRAAGLGLDESSVNTFLKWSFRPAMLEGKPVRVRMITEVSFNIN